MTKIFLPALMVASIAATGAFAGTPRSTAKHPDAKTADCMKQWKAEKKHSQSKKAFMAACAKA